MLNAVYLMSHMEYSSQRKQTAEVGRRTRNSVCIFNRVAGEVDDIAVWEFSHWLVQPKDLVDTIVLQRLAYTLCC